SLEQSRRLAVLTRSRMFDVLKLLGKEDVDQIDENLGREICRQANVSALVIASIRKFGQLYTIDLKVLDPRENEYLFTAREEGQGQESVPSMIDKLSEKTRIGLKEKAEEIASASEKVANVTTTNLEAYQHYFLGEQLMDRAKFTEAQVEYRKAIELDPTFGLAYYRLTYAISWYAGSSQKAKASMQKALELIDRIPEKERYMVRALNAELGGRYTAGISVLREMEQIYPDDKEMIYNIGDWSYHANRYATAAEYLEKVLAMDPSFERAMQHLTWTYADLGQYGRSLEYANRLLAVNEKEGMLAIGRYHASKGERATAADYFEQAFLMDPTDQGTLSDLVRVYENTRQYGKALEYAQKYVSQARNPFAYNRLAAVYVLMSDFSNALQTYEIGLQLFPDDPFLLAARGHTYVFMGEYEKAEAKLKTMIAEHNEEAVRKRGYSELSRLYPYLGKYSAMREMYDKRIEFAWKDKDTNAVALRTVDKAYWMYWLRANREEVLEEINKTMRFENITDYDYYLSLALLYTDIGDLEKSTGAAEKVLNPWDKMLLEARAHHAKKEWDQAISLYKRLVATFPNDQAYYGYVLALCYYEKGKLEKAIEEVKAAQGFYGWFHSIAYPRGYYLLGRIYERKGDKKLAVENYEKFLNLWKDADNDLRDLLDAKARLAKLKGMAAR
ncbi:MAG: tetratricopeptide repeat protein, partial [Bacteroidota bacterium]